MLLVTKQQQRRGSGPEVTGRDTPPDQWPWKSHHSTLPHSFLYRVDVPEWDPQVASNDWQLRTTLT